MRFLRRRSPRPHLEGHWETTVEEIRIVGTLSDGTWSFSLEHDHDRGSLPSAPGDGPYPWRYLAEDAAVTISRQVHAARCRDARAS